jgi:hypothetical protein
MNSTRKIGLVKLESSVVAVLTILLFVSASALAKDHKVKAVDSSARVVAHIPFDGLSTVDMTMQRKVNGKYYLYVQHAKDQGISILDISQPDQPKAVALIPWPDPTASSRMNVTGNLAIIAENGSLPARRIASEDDLVLWDLSNPAAPRVVQKFSGVIKWLQDERDFVYVLNGEGLWIVSKPADRQPGKSNSSDSYGG